ncbi:putative DMT superfamily transporter inner membrane protein [Pseudovibrio axinellae]|uniref:Putative DMT superfamily transporter inner membrane protein n=1 Tax=Pseudovibrio axinellae TaxID=989403 RepID=A0A165WXW2_9HYPH|nr:DMT family transporter [Pseudovibrio axinellae]KZL17021.1 putative DMT superfamily transporter inner membrane protein [Pseudovibrio axinellae]SEQ16474.1 Permease of the drug/metabolite transporter (DMT) superfamily [Pseudovibrio axinellae]
MSNIIKLTPVIFVLLWSTGFIGARLGAPYSEPFAFLSLRFLIVLPLMGAVVWMSGRSFALTRHQLIHAITTGMLVHGVYLSGVFWAIANGMPAGVTALVTGLQPFITGTLAYFLLKEDVTPRQWLGLAAGFGGIVLVILPKLGTGLSQIPLWTVPAAFGATLGIAFGTALQKRQPTNTDLVTGTFYQYFGALLIALPLSFTESWVITWSGDFIFALAWLVIVLSIGAVLLLMYLLQHGAASTTATLFYLTPVAAAIESYFLFDETLDVIQLIGMAVVVVAIAAGRPRQKA